MTAFRPLPDSAAPPARSFPLAAVVSIVALAAALLDAGQMYVKERLDNRGDIAWNMVLFQAGDWLFLGAVAPIAWYMVRRFPLTRTTWKGHLAVHVAGAATFCIVWASLGVGLGHLLDTWMTEGPLAHT